MTTQDRCAVRLGPLGAAYARVLSFRGSEALSHLYRFEVTIVSPLPLALFETLVLGQRANLVARAAQRARSILGIATAIRAEGTRIVEGRAMPCYTIRIEPRAALLRYRKNTRIFRRLRVDQVIDDVAHAIGVETHWDLDGEYPVRDYTTQYDETDLELVERLAAENGLLYSIDQPAPPLDMLLPDDAELAAADHDFAALSDLAVGALSDSGPCEVIRFTNRAAYRSLGAPGVASALDRPKGAPLAGPPWPRATSTDPQLADGSTVGRLPLRRSGALAAGDECLTEFAATRAVRSTHAAFREFDPARPLAPQQASAAPRGAASSGMGTAANLSSDALKHASNATAADALEVYEHGGHHLFPDWRQASREPERILARARRHQTRARGVAQSVRIEAGRTFELEDHPEAELNVSYVVTRARHAWHARPGELADTYSTTFECVPATTAYLPAKPRRRIVHDCVTAIVTGPAEHDIHTNEHGEIKVKFHWDRSDARDDSSVWIRALQSWAGAGWGAQFIPRVGMEVVIAFENGDPDRPLCIGAVSNGISPMPFALPADKTRSGWRTRSSPRGEGFNELSFEDASSKEQILLRAQRDFDCVVLRNRTAEVRADDRLEVQRHRTTAVHGHDSLVVDGHRASSVLSDDRLEVHGTRETLVHADLEEHVRRNASLRVEGTERREVVGETMTITHADAVAEIRGSLAALVGRHNDPRSATLAVEGSTHLSSTKEVEIESDTAIVLRAGRSSVRITDDGVTIQGPTVTVEGKDARLLLDDGVGKLKVKTQWQVVSGDKIVMKSSGASVGLASEVRLDGSQILLNSPNSATDDVEPDDPSPTEISLVDDNGRPLGNQRYRIVLDDGSERSGFLDENGRATVDLPASGRIEFPALARVRS